MKIQWFNVRNVIIIDKDMKKDIKMIKYNKEKQFTLIFSKKIIEKLKREQRCKR